MEDKTLEGALVEEIREDNLREEEKGKLHPSEVTGCPLKVVLDKMTDNQTILNSWLFQGTAVHYFLQESGIMDHALHEAGFHMMDVDYEIRTEVHIGDGIYLTGQADVVAHKDGKRYIYDIKYSSIRPSSGSERLFKYFSQANTYSYMFDADEYGLIMINSRSQDLLGEEHDSSDIVVMDGNEPNDENWELVKEKALGIHETLAENGYYDNVVWNPEDLEDWSASDWKPLWSQFSKDSMPSYDKECNYCDHSDYCPIKNGNLDSGLASMKGGL